MLAKRTAFKFAARASMVVAFLIVVAWMYFHGTGRYYAQAHFITLSNSCHLQVDPLENDVRLAVFDTPPHSHPSHRRVFGLPRWHTRRPAPTVEREFDHVGISCRVLRFSDGSLSRTFAISFAYPLGLALILPLVWGIANFQLRRKPDSN